MIPIHHCHKDGDTLKQTLTAGLLHHRSPDTSSIRDSSISQEGVCVYLIRLFFSGSKIPDSGKAADSVKSPENEQKKVQYLKSN
jgi:hypothetical protein